MRKITIREIVETIKKLLGNVRNTYIPIRPGDYIGKEEINIRKGKNGLD